MQLIQAPLKALSQRASPLAWHPFPFQGGLPLGIAAPSYYNPEVLPQIDGSSLLGRLTRERLVEVGRGLGVSLSRSARKERQIEAFLASAPPRLVPLIDLLQRDELEAICRQHGLPDGDRARLELALQVLVAAGESDGAEPVFATDAGSRELPRPGDVVRVRHRQYLVETVKPPLRPRRRAGPPTAHRVRPEGSGDDCQGGRPLDDDIGEKTGPAIESAAAPQDRREIARGDELPVLKVHGQWSIDGAPIGAWMASPVAQTSKMTEAPRRPKGARK